MTHSAIVAYVSPKISSNYSVDCLKEIAGKAVIGRLCDRLKQGLVDGDFTYAVLTHDRWLAARLEVAVPSTKIYVSDADSRLALFGDFLDAYPVFKTLLVFPEDAIFPDCRLTSKMLEM